MRTVTRRILKTVLGALVLLPLLATLPFPVFGSPEDHSATVPARHVDDVFDVANEEYKAGNYADAVRLYEGLLDGSEPKTADIFYNLGNAYFKLHKYGKAIASYRRALQIVPRDQDILANLRFVRSKTKDKIDMPKSTEMLHEIFFFHYGINRAESEIIFLIAYFATTLFAMVYLFRGSGFLRWLTIAALVPALIFGASTLLRAYRTAYPDEAVVVVEETNVYTGPGENYMISFNLHDGAELEVRKRADGWCQVELPNGRRGWLKNSRIEIVS